MDARNKVDGTNRTGTGVYDVFGGVDNLSTCKKLLSRGETKYFVFPLYLVYTLIYTIYTTYQYQVTFLYYKKQSF